MPPAGADVADGGRQVVRNVVLLGRAAVHHAADDPLRLAVQSVRRLPRSLRAPVAGLVGLGSAGRGVRGALAHFVADRPVDAAATLSTAPAPRTVIGRRLAAELAVQVGRLEDTPGGSDAAPAVTRAREAWRRGDVTAALELSAAREGSTRQHARLLSERRTLEPGFRLDPPPAQRDWSLEGGPRVLHVLTNSLPHTTSGYSIRSHAVLVAQREARIVAEAVTRIGYPVTVGLPWARVTDVVDGVTYHRILPARLADTPSARLQDMARAITELAATFRPTVLHTTTNYANALVTEASARALRLPWVYEVRGQLEATWVASLPPGERAAAAASERHALLRAKETEMALAADHVVTLSETLRDDLLARGVPAERVTVVPNAAESAHLSQRLEPADARAAIGLPDGGLWVGAVSSLVDYEGLDTLLDAVASLRRDGVDVRTALVGDGVARPALRARAARLGLGDAVVMPGRVGRDEALLWLRALDVVALPRRDLAVCRVVSPLKPIEAMAAGRPVIASDLPALAEIVAPSGAGVLVPPGDPEALAEAIRSLAASPAARMTYGENGRAFASTRTWAANGRLYRSLYETLEARP